MPSTMELIYWSRSSSIIAMSACSCSFFLLEYFESHRRGLCYFCVLCLRFPPARLHHVYGEDEAAHSVKRDFQEIRLRHLAREAAPYLSMLLLIRRYARGACARSRQARSAPYSRISHVPLFRLAASPLSRRVKSLIHCTTILQFSNLCRRALCRARAPAELCRSTDICRAAESTRGRVRSCRALSVRGRSSAP